MLLRLAVALSTMTLTTAYERIQSLFVDEARRAYERVVAMLTTDERRARVDTLLDRLGDNDWQAVEAALLASV